MVQQVNKEWDVNNDTMDAYVAKIRKLENKFSGLEINHVIHDNNVGVDVLPKLGYDRANVPPGVFVYELHHPSIKTPDSSSIAQGPKEPDREVLMDRGRLAGDLHRLHPGVQTTTRDQPEKRRGYTYSKAQQRVHSSWEQLVQAWISIKHTHEVCRYRGR
jgi:hypothetical protein